VKPTIDQIHMAAEALHADNCPEGLDDYGCSCSDWTREAEVALEAVLTDIEERIEARRSATEDEASLAIWMGQRDHLESQITGLEIALDILRGES